MSESEQKKLFTEWLNQYRALFFKVVRVYAFDRADQEDLFQEICVQVWKSAPNFKEKSSVSTWLYRISLNTALKWKRKTQKHQDGRQPLEKVVHLLQKDERNQDERLNWLYEKIGKLDVIDRSLCLLMLDGLSYREMSNILGVSEANVGVKIHRVKKLLIDQSKKVEHYEF